MYSPMPTVKIAFLFESAIRKNEHVMSSKKMSITDSSPKWGLDSKLMTKEK